MRDNHDKMPELIDAYKRDGALFATVAVTLSGETRQFEIGLQEDAYRAAKQVLGTRPFDRLPGIPYRYFFGGSIGRTERGTATADFRIEQGSTAKDFRFEIPFFFAQNLLWFLKLKDFTLASHLRSVAAHHT
jgi:hypothetical protein